MTTPVEYLLAQSVDREPGDAWAWRCCDAVGELFVRDTGLPPPSQHGCQDTWAEAWHEWHRQQRKAAREWLSTMRPAKSPRNG